MDVSSNSQEGMQWLTDLNGLVITSSDEQLAICREVHTAHCASVRLQDRRPPFSAGKQIAACQIPFKLHGLIKQQSCRSRTTLHAAWWNDACVH